MRTKLTLLCVLALCLALVPASAWADKVAACGHIKVVVDVREGNAAWTNKAYTLELAEAGEGWKIAKPHKQAGEMIEVSKGTHLRLTFMDDQNHTINVAGSTGGDALSVEAGNNPYILLVTAKQMSNHAPIQFSIEGSKNKAAKIGQCEGGTLHIAVK